MFNVAKEMAACESMSFQNAIDVNSLLYPKSQGMMALEDFVFGSTSISTEGILSRIKERAAKAAQKTAGLVAKVTKFIWDKKWWITGALAVVAAFATTAVVIIKRGKDGAKGKSKEEAAAAGKSVKESIKKAFESAKEKVKKYKDEAKAAAKSAYRNTKAAGYKAGRRTRDGWNSGGQEKTGEGNPKVSAAAKVKGMLQKIVNALKGLFNMSKSAETDTAKAPAQISHEAINGGAVIGGVVTGFFAFMTLGMLGIPSIVVMIGGLLATAAAASYGS